jgi:two-component sensor histidine kinase
METDVRRTTVLDRELPPVLESVPLARELVVRSLPEQVREPAAIVVSELVANAVKHASGPVGVRVETAPGVVRVSVHDGSTCPPREGDGYGLRIVHRLARASGVVDDPFGKTVWAELDLAS